MSTGYFKNFQFFSVLDCDFFFLRSGCLAGKFCANIPNSKTWKYLCPQRWWTRVTQLCQKLTISIVEYLFVLSVVSSGFSFVRCRYNECFFMRIFMHFIRTPSLPLITLGRVLNCQVLEPFQSVIIKLCIKYASPFIFLLTEAVSYTTWSWPAHF